MGEIAEDMLDGTCCEMCGEFLWEEDEEFDPPGFPMYCSIECARDRGADKSQVKK